MAALLHQAGYKSTTEENKADIIIINTCSIREKAAQKVYSQLGRLKKVKQNRPGTIIAIGGCLAQEWGEEFFKKAPYLDVVFGTRSIHKLPELISKVKFGMDKVSDVKSCDYSHLSIRAIPEEGQVSAYVTIMQGCNNYCSYCVVPYLRGPEISREKSDIIEEIKFLADRGIKEVILLGQNVNSYGSNLKGGVKFTELLREIEEIEGIERIRFTTSHPKDLSQALIEAFRELEKLCEHIHLPVQSGSDRILKAMNRGYTKADYLMKIEKLRSVCPNIGITTDIIVGFPGEKEEDFKETLDLMEKVRFDNVFSFKYSERKQTKAASFPDKVDEVVKTERLRVLQKIQEEYTLEKHRTMVGFTYNVLVEGKSKESPLDLMGRTRDNKIVNFRGSSELIGRTIPVTITCAYLHSLRGETAT